LSARAAALPLLLAAGAFAALSAVLAGRPAPPEVAHAALTPQGCVTECQSRQTDCILACEGRVPCERQCLAAGKACERRCVALADAGVTGQGGSPQR
jgi:hypothetical protein